MKIDKLAIDKLKIGKLDLGKLDLSESRDAVDVKDSADEITAECTQELSDQAKQIAAQEAKLADRMNFDNDRTYYFSVIFKSTDARNQYLKEHGIKLISDDYVFYDDVKDRL